MADAEEVREDTEALREEVLRPVIIVACPKSATMYIAVLLNKLGLDFGHEARFIYEGRVVSARDGRSSWPLGAGYGVIPFDGQPPLDSYENPIILHQVRHPLDTMSSCQKISLKAWDYISQHIPLKPLTEENLPENCLRLWYYWNLKCEELAEWTYRIEALEEVWEEFCRRIGRPWLAEKRSVLRSIPKNINTAKPYRRLTWEELMRRDPGLTEKAMRLAERYGYEV